MKIEKKIALNSEAYIPKKLEIIFETEDEENLFTDILQCGADSDKANKLVDDILNILA